jgi:2-amino-4-hydroxy-6-hydroxymethyldihydropteridine diphosphokinase
MSRVYLLLGSNLNNRAELLKQAADLIANQIGSVKSASSIYESEPWGFESDQYFLNQVLEIESRMTPIQLLEELLAIEKRLGRTRSRREGYQSRIIDIDILFYDTMILESDILTIPHPKLHERLFTLIPLSEISRDMVHPGLKKTIEQLVQECPDRSKVLKF